MCHPELARDLATTRFILRQILRFAQDFRMRRLVGMTTLLLERLGGPAIFLEQ